GRSRTRRLLRRGVRGHALDDGLPGPRLEDRENEREHDESDERSGRQLVQERRRAARAEGRLAASAPEGAGNVRALALLEQDHEDQEEADDDVQDDQGYIHGTSKRGESLAARGKGVKRARSRRKWTRRGSARRTGNRPPGTRKAAFRRSRASPSRRRGSGGPFGTSAGR